MNIKKQKIYILVGKSDHRPLAKKIKKILPSAIIYGNDDKNFFPLIKNNLQATLQYIYNIATIDQTPIIALMNSGLIIRTLAPLISKHEKFSAPPILYITSNQQILAPLLGEHHGGGRLGAWLAKNLSLQYGGAVIPMADDLPPYHTMAGKKFLPLWLQKKKTIVTDWHIPPPQTPQIIPACLMVGIGIARLTPYDIIEKTLTTALRKINAHPSAIASFGSVMAKIDEPSLAQLEKEWQKPLYFFDSTILDKVAVPSPSSSVRTAIGTASVAEASSLLLSGWQKNKKSSSIELLLPKYKNSNVTIAIAINHQQSTPHCQKSIRRGKISVVGIGPGDASLRNFSAVQAIVTATDVVGYQFYLDLIQDLVVQKKCHHRPLGQEQERVNLAIDLALEGKNVALISSGDAGIYALGSLLWQELDHRKKITSDNITERKLSAISVETIPAVSAFQALSAKIGAPAGNDFAVISLSDIMTKREKILERIETALKGDFPLFLYNPRSKTRHNLLLTVIAEAKKYRPLDTPIVIGKNLYRPAEKIIETNLKDFLPETVDMFSCIFIGASTTAHSQHGGQNIFYALRGYQNKN